VPGSLPRLLVEHPLTTREDTIATVAGLVVVVWLALVILDKMLAATLIIDQLGGVPGEFVLFGLLGAILSGWWGSRPT
jgi:hypothetical protein